MALPEIALGLAATTENSNWVFSFKTLCGMDVSRATVAKLLFCVMVNHLADSEKKEGFTLSEFSIRERNDLGICTFTIVSILMSH